MISPDSGLDGYDVYENLCSLESHPIAEEVKRYYAWKKANTKVVRHISDAASWRTSREDATSHHN
jgi:hypothetical protein